MKNILKKKSTEYLQYKKRKSNVRIKRECGFCILYGGVAIGTSIATGLSAATSAPGTVPATILASASCISSYCSFKNYLLKKKVIEDILKTRKRVY